MYIFAHVCTHIYIHTHTLLAGEEGNGQISDESTTLFCDSSLATMEGVSHRGFLFSAIKTGKKILYDVTAIPSQSIQAMVDFSMVGCF